MSITMIDYILHIMEKYAIKLSTWCWHKRLMILNKKRFKKK
jgi:hypothetical protein